MPPVEPNLPQPGKQNSIDTRWEKSNRATEGGEKLVAGFSTDRRCDNDTGAHSGAAPLQGSFWGTGKAAMCKQALPG